MAKGHSRGAAGGWRHGKTQAIRDEHGVIREYSAGPQNVNLDGSNYRGGQGATFSDIHKALARAEAAGARRITVATLIRRDSQTKGFRWVSTSRSVDEFAATLTLAEMHGMGMGELAYRVHATSGREGGHGIDHPVSNALTWTIIPEG